MSSPASACSAPHRVVAHTLFLFRPEYLEYLATTAALFLQLGTWPSAGDGSALTCQDNTTLGGWVGGLAPPGAAHPRAVLGAALLLALALAYCAIDALTNRVIARQMSACNLLLVLSLCSLHRSPPLPALKRAVDTVGVAAGVLCVVLSATVSLGIRRLYQRSLYCYGADLDLKGVVNDDEGGGGGSLNGLRATFEGVVGNGPQQVVRQVTAFEEAARTEGRKHVRARWFAREWYQGGVQHAHAVHLVGGKHGHGRLAFRALLGRALACCSLFPKSIATLSVGAFLYMVLCLSWSPLLSCAASDGGATGCSASCTVVWDRVPIGLCATWAVFLFMSMSPDGSTRSQHD